MHRLIAIVLISVGLVACAPRSAVVDPAQHARDVESVTHWRAAAERGSAEAQSNLGYMYAEGRGGLPRDDAEAVKWYRKAAEQGLALGQSNLGSMYQLGRGVPQDDAEAVRWYRKAAEQGDPTGQMNLGSMYQLGRGVPQDDTEALKWYRKAAEQGLAAGQSNLGTMYFEGWGTPQDDEEAVKWFRRAAAQGFANGQNNLGFAYWQGRGVPRDDAEAYFWIELAAAQGHEKAARSRFLLRLGLDEEQIAAAEKRARAWRPSKSAAVPDRKPERPPVAEVAAAPEAPEAGQATRPPPAAEVAEAPAAAPAVRPAPRRGFHETPVQVTFPRAPANPDDVAVIIANADYRKLGRGIPNVAPAYADARGIRRYIIQALGVREGNIIDLRDATSAQLVRVFGSKDNHKGELFDWVRPGRSRVFVYYAGHGAPAGKDGSAYLVPADADAARIELNGYPLDTLYGNLGKIPARSITVVLEACFSGVAQSGSLLGQVSPIAIRPKTASVPSNVTAIAAGAADQMATWEPDGTHSLFTKYFLKGMSGEADKSPFGDGDGTVAWPELDGYLKDTLTYYARRYHGRDQAAQFVTGR